MRKKRHLTLVVSATAATIAGLASADTASANPLTSFRNTSKPPELSIVGNADLERVNQKVESLRKRTEQAKANLEAAKAHLRAAEAEYRAARGEKEALILRNKASELASVADGEQIAAKAPKEATTTEPASVEPTTVESLAPSTTGGRIDPARAAADFNAQPQAGTLDDLMPGK